MRRIVLNEQHTSEALGEALKLCRYRLMIATADVKDLLLPSPGGELAYHDMRSILQVFGMLSDRNIEVQLLHGGIPSKPFREELKRHWPPTLEMRRCPRMHLKAVIADGKHMYLGSANLTGAGMGAKGSTRRNFEAGLWTDELSLIDPVADLIHAIWSGEHCNGCGRKDVCPVPLEEPEL